MTHAPTCSSRSGCPIDPQHRASSDQVSHNRNDKQPCEFCLSNCTAVATAVMSLGSLVIAACCDFISVPADNAATAWPHRQPPLLCQRLAASPVILDSTLLQLLFHPIFDVADVELYKHRANTVSSGVVQRPGSVTRSKEQNKTQERA